ncbi:SDR family NAD(P)-dependent oxidoreductase [Hypericibacter sp.]|uniref:SDR family NAD(P)-dependent oxidoreductase n=1 Tax=Hypericibacter sp. TaxID=2705401 RepID=UPI003D6CE19A
MRDAENDRVAIVTGASRGIGAAVAERLAEEGFTVIVGYSGDAAAAEALARQIETRGGRARAAKADMSDPDSVRGLFGDAEARYGGVDLLINNAGIMTLSNIVDTDELTFERLVNGNLRGLFNSLRESANRLRDGGRFIYFSAGVVGLLQPTYGVYGATKAAVEAMTNILAKELRGGAFGIDANSFTADPSHWRKPQPFSNRMAELTPGEELRQPDDIAGAVAVLARCNGGWTKDRTCRQGVGAA